MLSKMQDKRLKFILVDLAYDPLNQGSIFPAEVARREGTSSGS